MGAMGGQYAQEKRRVACMAVCVSCFALACLGMLGGCGRQPHAVEAGGRGDAPAATGDDAGIGAAAAGTYGALPFDYLSMLMPQDVVPPEAVLTVLYTEPGEEKEPMDFVERVFDLTKVSASYVSVPDFSRPGRQSVDLLLTDSAGNKKQFEAELRVRPVRYELAVEAGSKMPDVGAFLLDGAETEARFETDMGDIDMSRIGEHDITVRADGTAYMAKMRIVDTLVPWLTLKNLSTYTTDQVDAEDFIDSAIDSTALSFSYVKAPDYSVPGEQEIVVRAVDEGGNYIDGTALLTVLEDTEPPVIEGVRNLAGRKGGKVDYSAGVSVRDNHDAEVSLSVDSSRVNIDAEGSYPVVYSAVDLAGNRTELSAMVKIIDDAEPPVISGAGDIAIVLYERLDCAAGVTVTDNRDAAPSLQIDTSQVNPYEAGTYPVTYLAEDEAGNLASVSAEVEVVGDPEYDWFYAAIADLKEAYPDGAYWNRGGVTDQACHHARYGTGTCNVYAGVTNGVYPTVARGMQCLGFASKLSDSVFGTDTQVYLYEGYENIRPGDQIRLVAREHSLFVIGKTEDYVVVAECNADYQTCKIEWGRRVTRKQLESTSVLYISRYDREGQN